MSEAIKRVEVEVARDGIGFVRIDGTDISAAVTRVTVHSAAGELPRVELWVLPEALVLDVEGTLTLKLDEG